MRTMGLWRFCIVVLAGCLAWAGPVIAQSVPALSDAMGSEEPTPTSTQDAAAPEATGIEGPDDGLTIAEDLRNLDFVSLFVDIWHFQLLSVNGDAITVGKLIVALLILLIGLYVAKRFTLVIRHRLSRLRRIDVNAAAAISRILYYLLAVAIVFAAMDFAGIPLTVFTLLGGAVAIGIGFGVQNLFNNLISSLILMVERPIRLGDIVVVDEHEGKIEDIGNRCTRLRRSDGVDILIPNSYFLEQAVINWTLLDNDVRGKVAVGVAYGSDTGLTRDLILKATNEHGRIKDDPEPVVLFQEFGDNSLNFEVWFWVTVRRPIELRTVESDLRFRIDELFREAGIEIAFPQRDVHLDTVSPVQVEMIQPRG